MKNIVLLHGALGNAQDLHSLSEALTQQGFRTYSFTFSGHGDEPSVPEFGIEQFSRELKDFILNNNINEPSVFGYSMGGYVTLFTALQDPSLLKKIITLGTKFDWSKESLAKELKSLDPDLLKQKVPAFTKLLETKHGPDWTRLLEKTGTLMQEISDKDFLNFESLKAIHTPVLMGRGDRDQMVNLNETRAVFETLSHAALYILPGTKHPIESAPLDVLVPLISHFINRP